MKRTPLKRKQPRRLWEQANEKVEREGCCRACGKTENVQRAHLVPRRFDPEITGPRGGRLIVVPAAAIMPLCGGDHFKLDAGALSVWHLMTEDERAYARDVLGEARAKNRLGGATQ